jgi:ribosomal-protein-serine acetyltransferase
METLEVGPRLVARPAGLIEPDGLAAFVNRNLVHLSRYLPAVAELRTVEAVRSHLAWVAQQVSRGELWEWYLFFDGEICGAVRLNQVEPQNRKAGVAYYLGADFQGRGLATAAVRTVLGYAFGTLEMHRIELRCAVDNRSSARLAERLGFVREGELRGAEYLGGVFVNLYVYGLLRAELLSSPTTRPAFSGSADRQPG